tara:strand:- start:9692 stop:9958 length:267 start_codon:yes stop_codon:yes gene_type:complete
MSIQKKTIGATLATAAAAMFIAGAAMTGAPSVAHADVKCAGINSCKGTGSCASASNACKGQNTCKGQGWVTSESASDCTSKGGAVIKG